MSDLKPSEIIKLLNTVSSLGNICTFEYGNLKFTMDTNKYEQVKVEQEYITPRKTDSGLEHILANKPEPVSKESYLERVNITEDQLNHLMLTDHGTYEKLMAEEVMGDKDASEY